MMNSLENDIWRVCHFTTLVIQLLSRKLLAVDLIVAIVTLIDPYYIINSVIKVTCILVVLQEWEPKPTS